MLPTRDFPELYERFRRPVLAYVRSRIKDPETAAELTQEIFLKAFRFRHDYRSEHALSTWLWTIARTSIADHLRGIRVRPSSDPSCQVDELPSSHPSAERLLFSRDGERAAHEVLKLLTRSQRRVFLLRAVHQLTFPEIAKRMGHSLTAVKNL